MGKLDILTKEYMKRPSVFADVLNQFIYKGRQVIHPDRLVELDTTEITIPYGGSQASVPVQKYRDVSKILTVMTDQKAAYCILAVENEGKINYAMPVKNGLYDFINLAGQVTKAEAAHKASKDQSVKPTGDEFISGFWKNDRLLPVITVVVYFGSETWDGPVWNPPWLWVFQCPRLSTPEVDERSQRRHASFGEEQREEQSVPKETALRSPWESATEGRSCVVLPS